MMRFVIVTILAILPCINFAQSTRPKARVVVPAAIAAVEQSIRPQERPKTILAMGQRPNATQTAGPICGASDIQGATRQAILGEIRGCGVENPVAVRSVAGVNLTNVAIMDCTTAQTLHQWVTQGMKPAVGNYGGGVKEIHVAAHYACRTRNNRKGAKISEHGKGRAIDIAGFRMNDGSTLTVLKGWSQKVQGRILRDMWTAACGPFGTVLGPDANASHRDHFHFDTARYRSGSYCR